MGVMKENEPNRNEKWEKKKKAHRRENVFVEGAAHAT